MCGISGFCNFKDDYTRDREQWRNVLMDMRRSIAHRGKDQTGEYLDANVGLSHTRLSIRDVSGGVQPMCRSVGGADYIIVYNGEIYNTDELVPELKRKGYVFTTTGDTEVILYAYIEYGLHCASLLNGIFAFAIWDQRERRLVLCRDRLGVKPLFYTLQDGLLVFGSEIKALFQHPKITPQVDEDSFREIFAVGPARTPGNGVFRGIHEVLPGNLAVFSGRRLPHVCLLDAGGAAAFGQLCADGREGILPCPRCHPPANDFGRAGLQLPLRGTRFQHYHGGCLGIYGGSRRDAEYLLL